MSLAHAHQTTNSGTGRPAREEARPIGIWFNGARGSVATTATVGLLALRAGLVPPVGCVTERPPFDEIPLAQWDDIVVGGHDIVDTPLEKRAELLADAGVIPYDVLAAVREGLTEVEREIRPGYDPSSRAGSLAAVADRMATDIAGFRQRNGLERVVVIDVASTEPPFPSLPEHDDLNALTKALAEPGNTALPPSSMTAYAALLAGCAHVEFTPSRGMRVPALVEMANLRRLPYAGADGKTGQTLLRTTLAPMFAARALEVHSWSGTNLLGGGDGATLGDPEHASTKLSSKGRVLPELLGADVTAPLHIDNVPDLGEQKTSWDYVSFEGFLGARMSLQFTWSGIDSALAAPLVLDLGRLAAAAHAAGESGPLSALAFFFKDPIASNEHDIAAQVRHLAAWATGLNGRRDAMTS